MMKRITGGFPGKAFRICSQLCADFLLGGLGYFNNTAIPPLALIALIVGIIRLNARLRRARAVVILYWIGLVLSFDFIAVMAYAATASFGWVAPAAILTPYIVLLAVRKLTRWPSYMTSLQLLVVPVCILGLFLKGGELFNHSDTCGSIDSVPGARILNDKKYNFTEKPHTAIPRFFIPRPGRNDILVCDHVYVYEKGILVKNAINRLDTRTGAMTPWLARGNVLAIMEQAYTGYIFAVVQRNFKAPAAPNVELIKFGPDGKILDRIDLGLKRNTFYGASISEIPGKLLITVEANFFHYSLEDGGIERFTVPTKGLFSIYRVEWHDPFLYTTFSVSPLFTAVFGAKHLLKISVPTREVVDWMIDYPSGIYDVEKRPGRDQLGASRNCPPGAWLLDFDMNKIRKLVMPPGVREIEFSRDGKYLFGTGLLTGKLFAVDVERNRLAGEMFVGYGSRGMTVSPDGDVIIGSSCGVVGVDPDEFLGKRR